MTGLDRIAQQMRSRLETVQCGYIRRALFGGLQIALERRDNLWRLAIARINQAPSKTEAKVVGRAFRLPAGIEWSWTQKPVRNVNVGRGRQPKMMYRVAECRWLERDPEEES